MSIRDTNCGATSTRSVAQAELCKPAVVKINYHQCDPVQITKRRVPFMVRWCPQHAPYPAGSLVIHEDSYWYTGSEEYAPPGATVSNWKPWDLETWLTTCEKLMSAETSFLSFPVYQEPDELCGVTVKIAGSSVATPQVKQVLRAFRQDSIVVADGKLYYALQDNACTYPPSSQWGGGVSLNDLILKLLKQGG